MADTYTTNLNLTKPEPGAAEDTWGISLNADLDSLDAIFSSSGTQINLNPNQVNFADGKKAIFGTGNDLSIFHDGSNSIIQDSGAGNLQLRGASFVIMQSDDGENMVRGQKNAGVRLYYDGATKLDTTSSGIDVTGTISSGAITSTGNSQMANLVVTGDLTVQGTTTTVNTDDLNVKDKNITLNYSTGDSSASANGAGITIQDAVSVGNDATILWNTNFDNFDFSHTIRIPDSQKVEFGADADLQIYHESGNNHSVIKETGTGNLKIQAANIEMQIPNGTQNYLQAINGGAVTLYNNGSAKIATTSTGINVTGTVTSDGLTVSDSQAGGVTAQIQNSNPTQTGGTRLDFLYSGSTVTGRIQNRFNGGDFQTDWYTGNDGLEIFTDLAKTEKRLAIASNGDISFYDDTGTSQNLKWDASASSLGFVDNAKAQFGASNDLQIYHDGSHSHIINATGDLTINSQGDDLILKASDDFLLQVQETDIAIQAVGDGKVGLRYNNAEKLATTSTGIDVTGTVTSDGLTVTSGSSLDNILQVFGGGTIYAGLGVDGTGAILTAGSSGSADSDLIIKTSTGGTEKQRARFQDNGDISFYDDTGSTQGLFWDASAESLGIGTTSPSQDLEILNGVSGSGIRLAATSTAYWDIERDPTSGHLTFTDDGAGTVLTVGQDGNVGIGTNSPEAKLHVQDNTTVIGNGSSGYATINFHSATTGSARYGSIRKNYDSPYDMRIRASNSTNSVPLIFETASSSEAGRFDASGNLLVGKTSASTATVGVEAQSIGLIKATRSGSQTITLNRLTSDGDIAVFKKDGSTVGSIGTNNDDLLIYSTATGHKGLRFAGGEILPVSNAGALEDNTTDLGSTAYRFKNLQLSGTINVGSTTSLYEGAGGDTFLKNTTSGADLFLDSGRRIRFTANGSERMRIDSSGNVLVGKTAASSASIGFQAGQSGFTAITRASAQPLVLNRTTNDGIIAEFKKDSTQVGSIGTSATDLFIGTGVAGLRFREAGSQLMPWNTTTNAANDSAIDIGKSDAKFKDLHLSGTANVGAINITGTGTSTFGGAITVQGNITTDGGDFKVGTNTVISSARAVDNVVSVTSSGNIQSTGGAFKWNVDGSGYHYLGTDIFDGLLMMSRADETIKFGSGETVSTTDAFQFWTSTTSTSNLGSKVFSITSGGTANFTGSVGIGTSSPAQALEIAGSVRIDNGASFTAYEVYRDNILYGKVGGGSNQFTIQASNNKDINIFDDSGNGLTVKDGGNIGIGTNSPTESLHTTGNIRFGDSAPAELYTNSSELRLGVDRNNDNGTSNITFYVNNSESARIDASGRLGIGTTSPSEKLHVVGNAEISGNVEMATFLSTSNATVEGTFTSEGLFTTDNKATIEGSKSSATDHILQIKNKNTSNEGRYLQFTDNTGTNIGQIGHVDQTESNLFISTFGTGLKFESYITYKAILPCNENGADSDNAIDLGSSSVRFDDIYATNGTIQTSDRNQKQDIQALTDAEQRVATACKGLIRRFRWQDSVAEKDDNPDSDETARYHFGVIAQDLQDAFTAEGLDASDYGMFISSTWEDDDGVEQTRLGVRYNELLAFIITTL